MPMKQRLTDKRRHDCRRGGHECPSHIGSTPALRRLADAIVRSMLTRRSVLLSTSAAMAARSTTMSLCLHQTTSAAAGFRRSLEGYAKAGIKYVEVIPPHVDEFLKKEGMPAARRLLSDLG